MNKYKYTYTCALNMTCIDVYFDDVAIVGSNNRPGKDNGDFQG